VQKHTHIYILEFSTILVTPVGFKPRIFGKINIPCSKIYTRPKKISKMYSTCQ